MKKWIFIIAILPLIGSCGGGGEKKETTAASEETASTGSDANPSYDPKRGEGKFKDVQIAPALDKALADAGLKVYELKCASCHKLTDERLVGPGWKGVTQRRTPEWIMNFTTNTEEMLEKDPVAQAQLEICLVRMPNQNIPDEDARRLYEFMRKNDGVQ